MSLKGGINDLNSSSFWILNSSIILPYVNFIVALVTCFIDNTWEWNPCHPCSSEDLEMKFAWQLKKLCKRNAFYLMLEESQDIDCKCVTEKWGYSVVEFYMPCSSPLMRLVLGYDINTHYVIIKSWFWETLPHRDISKGWKLTESLSSKGTSPCPQDTDSWPGTHVVLAAAGIQLPLAVRALGVCSVLSPVSDSAGWRLTWL